MTTPVPISKRLRDYLREFSPVVGITPETITAEQVPRWERVAAMVLRVPARGAPGGAEQHCLQRRSAARPERRVETLRP